MESLGFTLPAKPEMGKKIGRKRAHLYDYTVKRVTVTLRGERDDSEWKRGIGEDWKQKVMTRLATLKRHSNLVMLRDGKHK